MNNNLPDLVDDVGDSFSKVSLRENIVSHNKIITVDTCKSDASSNEDKEGTTPKDLNNVTSRRSAKRPSRRVQLETVSSRNRRGRGSGSGQVVSSRWEKEKTDPTSPKDVPMKNAVMMLNEMFPPPAAPQYRVTSMTGTPNNLTFSMSCTLLEKTYSGTGRSKK